MKGIIINSENAPTPKAVPTATSIGVLCNPKPFNFINYKECI